MGSQERNKNFTWRITTCHVVLLLDFQTNMYFTVNNNNFLLLCMSINCTEVNRTVQALYFLTSKIKFYLKSKTNVIFSIANI